MAVLELYGKCKELGYCDCGGFLGCVDPKSPLPHTDDPVELRNAMQAEREISDYKNHNLARLIDCTVCDRSHTADHPHIANIDGDTPIDGEQQSEVQVFGALPPEDQLPEWLRNKPGSQAIRPKDGRGGSHDERKCDVCGKIKRTNHNCKGKADAVKAADECKDCKRAGELCVRHGGVWSDYDTPKGGEQVARKLPEPVPVTLPAPAAPVEQDMELAAIGTILKAVEGLESKQLKRVMGYVSARLEETE